MRDYGAGWTIDPTFSDFKRGGFNLEASQIPGKTFKFLLGEMVAANIYLQPETFQ